MKFKKQESATLKLKSQKQANYKKERSWRKENHDEN